MSIKEMFEKSPYVTKYVLHDRNTSFLSYALPQHKTLAPNWNDQSASTWVNSR